MSDNQDNIDYILEMDEIDSFYSNPKNMNTDDLIDLAKELRIKGFRKMKKEQLIKAINEAREEED